MGRAVRYTVDLEQGSLDNIEEYCVLQVAPAYHELMKVQGRGSEAPRGYYNDPQFKIAHIGECILIRAFNFRSNRMDGRLDRWVIPAAKGKK